MDQSLIIRIMADGLVVPVVLLGAYALMFKIPNKHKLESYKRILLAGLTAYLFAKIIGFFYQPSGLRPFELLGTVAGASYLNNPGFPSDHMLFVTAIAFAVWFETKNRIISLILAILVVMIGLGRVLALVHTPLDVIGGALIALAGSVWYLNCINNTKK